MHWLLGKLIGRSARVLWVADADQPPHGAHQAGTLSYRLCASVDKPALVRLSPSSVPTFAALNRAKGTVISGQGGLTHVPRTSRHFSDDLPNARSGRAERDLRHGASCMSRQFSTSDANGFRASAVLTLRGMRGKQSPRRRRTFTTGRSTWQRCVATGEPRSAERSMTAVPAVCYKQGYSAM